MKELPNYASNVINETERELFDLEVHNFQSDDFLPQMDAKESIDMWWRGGDASLKYPLLSRLALALLTCFHGPKVESSFSLMNNIIKPGTNRLNISTFDAIQSVKYELMSQNKTSVSMFQKKDFLKEKIDPKLCYNIKTARKFYKEELLRNKTLREERRKKLDALKDKSLTKKAAKKLSADAAKKTKDWTIKRTF